MKEARSSFLAGGAPGQGEASPGDHLQTAYGFWLVGHQLERGGAPWRDPYTFQPESEPATNLRGWPFGFAYWPLERAFGVVVGWNLLALLGHVLAGGLACAWLRELGVRRWAAIAGGVAFALAPYRVEQSTGHLLGPIAILLPLALLAFERARRGAAAWLVLAAAALASIPLSGQVHLALGTTPFFVLYALCRTRERALLTGAALAVASALVAGVVVKEAAIDGSINAGGRSLSSVDDYSAGPLDFVLRDPRHGSERFVFLGWLTPLVAAAGLAVLLRERRRGLALALGLGAVVPIVLALGTTTPVYSLLWHALPPLRYPRVPARLMPIACLALAALVAFAVARLRFRLAPLVVVPLLFLDLHVPAYGASRADEGNRAYAALRAAPDGRLLEVPVFRPGIHYGSVYQYYAMQSPRGRPAGYSTLAPRSADRLVRTLEQLNCGEWTGGAARRLERLGVRYVALHGGLYRRNPIVPDTSWFARRELARRGFVPLARGGAVTMFARGTGPPARRPPGRQPSRARLQFCQHWRAEQPGRVTTSEHAAFWVFGDGRLALRVAAARPLAASFAVDGRRVVRHRIGRATTLTVPLGRRGWHLVSVDVPELVEVDGEKSGVRLLSARRQPAQ